MRVVLLQITIANNISCTNSQGNEKAFWMVFDLRQQILMMAILEMHSIMLQMPYVHARRLESLTDYVCSSKPEPLFIMRLIVR